MIGIIRRQSIEPRHFRSVVRLLFLIFSICLISLPAFSQGNAGAIQGTISDQSGGIMVGVTVTITDVQRGTARSLTTDQAGAYSAPNLTPSTYTVRAAFTGFSPVERTGIILETGGNLRVDLSMQPGAQTQTVTVTEALPLVETTNAELGGTLNSDIVEQLPMNGRNFSNLLQLRPGVTIYPGGAGWAQSTNGMRAHDNMYLVDGISGNDPWMSQAVWDSVMAGGDAGTMISIDSIDEFKTEENPRAEYGWKPGGTVNVGIKSGTNTIHGTGFAYGRDASWDAINYFTAPGTAISHQLEQFGGTVGGPIVKDKLFYFASFEDQRYSIGFPSANATPITSTNTGIFDSSIGNGTASDSNLIAACQAAMNIGAVGSGTPGALTALSAQLAGLSNTCTPLPNYPGLFPVNSGTNGLPQGKAYINPGLQAENQIDSGLGKINYHVNDKNSLTGMYYISPGSGPFVDGPSSQMLPYQRTSQYARSMAFAGNWTWTPNATWANEARVGYTHYYQSFLSGDASQDPSNYNFNGSTYHLYSGNTNPFNFGMPSIATGVVGLGAGWPKIVGPNGVLQITDHISVLRGNHSFKFGGEIQNNQSQTDVTANAKGSFGFDGLQDFFSGYPNGQPGCAANNSGSCSGGVSDSILTGNLLRNFTYTGYALFLQDDYRIRPRLILNLGVRWEMNTVPTERNKLQANFVPGVGLVQGNEPFNGDHNNFSPRIGLAWDMFGNGKTVFRAAGGVLYEQLSLDVFNGIGNSFGLRANPTGATNVACSVLVPNTGAATSCATTPIPGAPAGTFGVPVVQNPAGTINSVNIAYSPTTSPSIINGTVVGGVSQPGSIPYNWANNGPSTPLLNFSAFCGDGFTKLLSGPFAGFIPQTCNVMMVDPNMRTPYVAQWNVDIQRAITSTLSLTVGYVGNHGTKLISGIDLNQPGLLPSGFSPGWGNPSDPTSAAFACIGSAAAGFNKCKPNTANERLARPYLSQFPYYRQIAEYGNLDDSNYNGLQAVLTARNYHGLSATAGYTFAHALGVSSDQGTGGNNTIPLDSTGSLRSQLYGPTVFDIRQRGTLSVTYAMPDVKKVPGDILGGWSFNMVSILQTGLPWQVSDSKTDFSGTSEGLTGNTAGTQGQRWNFSGQALDWTPVHNFQAVDRNTTINPNGSSGIPYFVPGLAPNSTDPRYAVNNAACVAAAGGAGATLAYASLVNLGCYQLGTGVLTPAAYGSYGNFPKLPFRGAGTHNFDASITKKIAIKERYGAQFRVEVFNLFNTVHFVTPGNAVGGGAGCSGNPQAAGGKLNAPGSGLGCVTATPDTASSNAVLGSGGARAIQLGLKLTF